MRGTFFSHSTHRRGLMHLFRRDGAVSDIVSGLNFALTQSQASGRPSIVSMSLGGSASRALDNAVAAVSQ